MDDPSNPGEAGGSLPTPNPEAPGARPQETPPTSAGTETLVAPEPTPSTPTLDLRTLHAQLEQERQRIERLTQQYNGAQQEATRWRTEAERRQQEQDQRQQEQDRRQQEFQQNLLRLAGGGTTPEPEYTDLQDALDAWYQGKDPNAPRRYDAWLRQTLKREAKAESWQEMQERLTPVARITQMYERYPQLKTPTSEEYRAAHQQYQALRQDPYFQSLFPHDPAFAIEAMDPSTGQRTPVDIRLLEVAMANLAREQGIQQGRAQEAERRQAPTVEGRSPSGAAPTDVETPLMTAEEKAFIREHLQDFTQMGWGKNEAEIATHRWNTTISESEKQRRKRLAASGQWP